MIWQDPWNVEQGECTVYKEVDLFHESYIQE